MDDKKIKAYAGKLIFLCWIAYAVSYIGRLNFSACMSEIMLETQLTKTFAGTISTGYLACYGCGQLLNGIIGDRVSPKYMIGIGLFGAGAANAAMGFSSSGAALLVFWCLNGVFNSMLWSPVIRAFAEWLPESFQQRAGVNIAATIPTGKIFSYLISSLCLQFFSWRTAFFASSVILMATAVLWLVGISSLKEYLSVIPLIKRAREQSASPASATASATTSAPVSAPSSSPAFAPAITSVSLIKCIFATGLIFTVFGIFANGIIKDGVTQWVPTYVSEFFSVSAGAASALTAVLPIIELSGAYVAQWINKRFFNNEMTTSLALFAVCCLSIAGLFLLGRYNVVLAVVLVAVSTSSMLGVNNMFLTFIPLHFSGIGRSSSVTGFLNACSYIASAVSSVTIGKIAESYGWNTTILSWLAVAVAGVLICCVGVRAWGRGRMKIVLLSEKNSH